MAQWAVVIPAEQWATERLYQHDTLLLPGAAEAAVGDDVLLVADDALVGQGRVEAVGARLRIAWTRRAFDEPVPLDGELKPDVAEPVASEPGTALRAVPPDTYARAVAGLAADRRRAPWLVSLAMPIEANSPAEAVRQFWSYVAQLGPRELPTYVWPSGDELAMQAFVLGVEANQDPEEDDDA